MTASQSGEPFTWIGAAVAVVTFIAGFGAKWITEIIQHNHATEREREARREARRDLLLQRRYDFQRQVLLDLQEICMRLIRTAGQTNHHDVMTFRSTGKWERALLPDDVNKEALAAQSKSTMLMVRVRDMEVRHLTDAMKSYVSTVAIAKSQKDSDDALQLAWENHSQLNQRIGEILREMEEYELSSTVI
jgi:hypothetical protein